MEGVPSGCAPAASASESTEVQAGGRAPILFKLRGYD